MEKMGRVSGRDVGQSRTWSGRLTVSRSRCVALHFVHKAAEGGRCALQYAHDVARRKSDSPINHMAFSPDCQDKGESLYVYSARIGLRNKGLTFSLPVWSNVTHILVYSLRCRTRVAAFRIHSPSRFLPTLPNMDLQTKAVPLLPLRVSTARTNIGIQL